MRGRERLEEKLQSAGYSKTLSCRPCYMAPQSNCTLLARTQTPSPRHVHRTFTNLLHCLLNLCHMGEKLIVKSWLSHSLLHIVVKPQCVYYHLDHRINKIKSRCKIVSQIINRLLVFPASCQNNTTQEQPPLAYHVYAEHEANLNCTCACMCSISLHSWPVLSKYLLNVSFSTASPGSAVPDTHHSLCKTSTLQVSLNLSPYHLKCMPASI